MAVIGAYDFSMLLCYSNTQDRCMAAPLSCIQLIVQWCAPPCSTKIGGGEAKISGGGGVRRRGPGNDRNSQSREFPAPRLPFYPVASPGHFAAFFRELGRESTSIMSKI